MRIVAVSDLHGHLPDIPPCDLLIIAGDVCPDRVGPYLAFDSPEPQKQWFDSSIRPWLAGVPATHKILTWGNHDWCGEAFSFHQDSPAEASTTELQILVDDITAVSSSVDRSVTVWATPWSNLFMHWAFMKLPEELEVVYGQIPAGIDILVSHQPPYGHGDRITRVGSRKADHFGSQELLNAIGRVRPRLVICGHIHDGHGRSEYQGIPIYNVSVVNEGYEFVHSPTVIELTDAVSRAVARSHG